MSSLSLRPATRSDARLLWLWRNDESVRLTAFQTAYVRWETHCEWLEMKLSADDVRMWILEEDGLPVGQIRYDRTPNGAEIDVTVAPECRNRGLGKKLLQLSAKQACVSLGVEMLVGIVKSANEASKRVFTASGFRAKQMLVRDGEPCVEFVRDCKGIVD